MQYSHDKDLKLQGQPCHGLNGTWLQGPAILHGSAFCLLLTFNRILAAGIAFYLYFLTTQREFAYREWKNQMMTRLQVT